MEKVRFTLREFYSQLKAKEEYIKFVLVTGITKNIKGGLYSGFNNPIDITFEPEYGALTGFTQEEIELYYSDEINEAASELRESREATLEGIKKHYNGYCFDGKTFVYNPLSTLLFFRRKEFDNYWFESGTPNQLISFFKEMTLTFDGFHNILTDKKDLKSPAEDRFSDPAAYLFQLGYLSIRPGGTETEYLLDYPNEEVRESMKRRLFESLFRSLTDAKKARADLIEAFSKRDPAGVVDVVNRALSRIDHLDHGVLKPAENENEEETILKNEYFFRSHIKTLFYGAGLEPRSEVHGNLGRADLIVTSPLQTWVIELKVCRADTGDASLAAAAMKQIKGTNYGGGYKNPVLLGLVVNTKARKVRAWECEGGLSTKPAKPAEPAEPDEPEEEKHRPGPRPR